MIADGQMLIGGAKRSVGPEKLPDVGGVVNRRVEVRIVANRRRQLHRDIRHRHQHPFDESSAGRLAQLVGHQRTQALRGCRSERHQPIQRRPGTAHLQLRRQRLQQAAGRGGVQIEDLIPDRNADVVFAVLLKDPIRQVRQWKITSRLIRRLHPALRVGQRYSACGLKCFFSPCQHSKYSCCRMRVSMANFVGLTTHCVSNMNARVSAR